MAKSKKRSLLGAHINEAMQQQSSTEGNIKQSIEIKKELQNYIPPLSSEEYQQLEENLLKEGCRDALIVWKNGSQFILIDGHNRYAICQQHNLGFNIELKEFKNLGEVKEWMIVNQLGKRNLTEIAKTYLRGEQYAMEKKNKKNNLKQNTSSTKGQDDPSGNTAKHLAKVHKVSEKTIKRDQQYANGLNKLVGKDNDLKWKILNKDLDIPKKLIIELIDKPDKDVRNFKTLLLKENLSKAVETLKKENISDEKNQPDPVDSLQEEIVRTLHQLVKKKDPRMLKDLRKQIDNLENRLFP